MFIPVFLWPAFFWGFFALLPGCSTVQYLYQAGKGQLEIQNKAKPLDEVIKDETTPPRVRSLLEEIPRIKKFGESQGLKATPNYQAYVKLGRSAASYVVSAAKPLAFESKHWSFPFVGSFPYLGFFNVEDAKKYAASLKLEGWDVDLRGARAFSTLGWFKDPVLSTMLTDGDEAMGDLVNVVLHESTHATLYISGQSSFNESLAEFVAAKMTVQYFDSTRGKGSLELKAYEDAEAQGEATEKKLREAYEKLDQLYASSKPEADKLSDKKELLDRLEHDLGFKRAINNATLIQYRTYNTSPDAFEKVYQACGQDWRRFLGALSKLKENSFPQSQDTELDAVLLPIAQAGC